MLSTGSQREDDFMQSTSAGENSCSVLSKAVVCLYFTNQEHLNYVSHLAPTPTLWLISSYSFVLHDISALFVCAGKRHSLTLVCKRNGRKKTFIWAGEKVPLGRLRKPSRWYHQITMDREKRKGGCKKDGIQIEGWRGWMRGDLLKCQCNGYGRS